MCLLSIVIIWLKYHLNFFSSFSKLKELAANVVEIVDATCDASSEYSSWWYGDFPCEGIFTDRGWFANREIEDIWIRVDYNQPLNIQSIVLLPHCKMCHQFSKLGIVISGVTQVCMLRWLALLKVLLQLSLKWNAAKRILIINMI